MFNSFIFDASKGQTPESLARQRALAAQIMGQIGGQPARNTGEGIGNALASIGHGISANVLNRRANTAEQEGMSGASSLYDRIVNGIMGGPSTSIQQEDAPVGSVQRSPLDPASARVAQAHSSTAVPGGFSGSQQEFVDMLMPAALQASQRTGIDPRIIVAQAAQETGWGRSAPGNNYFGIKSHGKGGGQNLRTHEYVNGQRVNVNDSFRTFGSPEESVAGYADFIQQNPRYRPLMGAQGLDAQLEALQASGYATDPNYSRSVGQIARGIQLPQQQALEGMAVGEQMQMPQQQPAQMAQGGGMDIQTLMQAAANPWLNEGQRSVINALLQQQMQTQDPMRQLDMGIKQEQLNQLRNPRADPTDTQRNLAWRAAEAGLQPGTPEYNQFMITGGRNDGVTVNNMGNIPAGYQLMNDPETGAQRMEPIPGSPAAIEMEEATRSREGMRELTGRQLNPAIDDIQLARDLVEGSGLPTTGFIGSLLSNAPGTEAHSLANRIENIESAISLENLNQMRQNSPTGGALGNVSNSQMRLLSQAFGSLRQTQSGPELLYNLARMENILNDIVHGNGNGPTRIDLDPLRGQLSGGQRQSDTPRAGEIVDGYRFRGGDPSDPNSWERQ